MLVHWMIFVSGKASLKTSLLLFVGMVALFRNLSLPFYFVNAKGKGEKLGVRAMGKMCDGRDKVKEKNDTLAVAKKKKPI